jgi:pyrroloquinoline quinone (PQQ) biosynthesis protein C
VLAQIPYGPEELSLAPMSGADYVKHLDEMFWERGADLPSFYARLVAGELSPDDLQVWAKDLYPYWDATLYFTTGAAFVKTNYEPVRTHMLRKLVDIEGKDVVTDINGWETPAYEELWLRMGEAMGAARSDVEAWKPFTRSFLANETLRTLSRWWEWSWLDCVASMYAGDLFLKAWAEPVRSALASKYDVPADALGFFDAAIQDVDAHLAWESDTLVYWACTTERQLTASRALRTRLDIESQLLVAIDRAAAGEWLFQVP